MDPVVKEVSMLADPSMGSNTTMQFPEFVSSTAIGVFSSSDAIIPVRPLDLRQLQNNFMLNKMITTTRGIR
mgnify:CR=1 FL=1